MPSNDVLNVDYHTRTTIVRLQSANREKVRLYHKQSPVNPARVITQTNVVFVMEAVTHNAAQESVAPQLSG